MDFTRTETQAAVAEAVAGALTTAAPAEELLTAQRDRALLRPVDTADAVEG